MMNRYIVNPGRKETPAGGDAIFPYLDIEHRYLAEILTILRKHRIRNKVELGVYGPRDSRNSDLQVDRIRFLDSDACTISELLKPAPEHRPATRLSTLHYAACIGDPELLKTALSDGADVNSVDEYRGYTATHWLIEKHASGGARLKALGVLADNGADLHVVALDGLTPLALGLEIGADELLLEQLRDS